MQTILKFTQEDRDRLMAADRVSLTLPNGWGLRTQFEWNDKWEINLSDLRILPEGYKDVDELIRSFIADKVEWNQHFADFIRDFGMAALISAKDNVVMAEGELSGEWVSFEGEDGDLVHVTEVLFNFPERLISIVVKR